MTALTLVAWQYFTASEEEGALARLSAEYELADYRDGAIVWSVLIGLVILISILYYDPVKMLWQIKIYSWNF